MKLLPLFIAIALATAAALVALKFVQQGEEETKQVIVEVPKVVEQPVPQKNVLIARDAIPIGTVLTQQHMDRQAWPEHLILPDFIISDGQDAAIQGLVTRSSFQAREPLIRSRLANPKDPSFLAASLPKGMRAVTMPVDVISGVAGFVYPGDRVDVLITHPVPMGPSDANNPNSEPRKEQITEILLSDAKVIAVDQRASAGGTEGPVIPATVTLEVSAMNAQKLRLSERDGTLSLVLRPLEEDTGGDIARPTGISDLSRITPPSYFPVLYDTTSNYAPEVIDLFGDKAEGEGTAEKIEEKLAQSVMPGIAGGGAHTIYIVRGADRQSVGVDRP